MVGHYHMRMNGWWLRKLKEEGNVEDIGEVGVVIVVDQEVTCVTIVIKMDIMQKIVQNHQKKESHDCKMVDALYVMKKAIKRLIVLIGEVVEVVVNTEEVGVLLREEEEVQEVDPEAIPNLEETDQEDNSKFILNFNKFILSY